MVPCVAVPTTSGTGSEVGRCSIIVHEEERRKGIIFHPKMMPARVIADPALTLGLPSKITAAVGMDALSHNLEAFCSPRYHPQADGIALEGMKLCKRSLIKAFQDGSDISARSDMMAASLMGATAFQKGLGAMHAMSHPLGAHLHVHHGLANAIVMPYVLVRNQDVIEDRMVELARYLALEGTGTAAILQWVLDLRQKLGIPNTLASVGFEEKHCALLAPDSVKDPTAGSNPILLSEQDYAELFHNALHGILS
jgi:alcohol dehydrogenase class IV